MSRRKLVVGGGLLALLLVGAVTAGIVWYTVLQDDPPAEVTLSEAVASLNAAQSATPAPAQPTPAAAGASAAGAPPAPAGPAAAEPPRQDNLTGRWVLAPSSESFVGYRVKEELTRIGSATAVGRTRALTATLDFDGSAITGVQVTADLTRLQSDQSLRDGQLRTQALETNRFPTATFTLTQPIPIGNLPAEGTPVQAIATGDLTIHGVTRSVQIPLQGQRQSGFVVVVGSLEVQFADYNIAAPRAPSVVSVENRAVIELQLVFQQSSAG